MNAAHALPWRRARSASPLALLIALALAALVIAVLLPLASLLAMSFQDAGGAFIGFANYVAYAARPHVGTAIVNSVALAAASALLCVALAYGYAFALTQTCMPGKRLFRALALLPLLAPSLLMAIALIYLFGNQGLLRDLLRGFFPDLQIYGPFGIVTGSVLWTFPHALLILLTALSTSDGRLNEAATMLGASRWRIFRTVTWPASRYGALIAFMVVFVLVVTDFGVAKVVGGQTQMLATDIYKQVVGQQRLDLGAVVAQLLLLPALAAFAAERWLRARQAAQLGLRAVPHVPKPVRALDRAALAYCLVIAALLVGVIAVAAFASLATYWPYKLAPSLANYRFDLMDGGGWDGYANSLKLALATALVGAPLTFLSAYLVEKPRGFAGARTLINAIASLPLAVPGLALGLGYILFFNAPWNPLRGIYGGLAILVVCTVAHFYSVAHLSQLTQLRALDREYERVADTLGVPFWKTLLRVHLPMSLPTLLQVGGYFFVNALTTVSAVVFLYAPGTELAAIAVLAMDDAGDIGPAAAMAVLIFATAAAGRGAIALLEWAAVRRTQRWRAR